MIETTNLSKMYRVHSKEPGFRGSLTSLFQRRWLEKTALMDASLNVGEGEIVGLIGANGAGKTTLVKLLSGIMYPSQGSARVLGYVPWEKARDFRRQIAIIMGQKAQLWWDLPAADCFLVLKQIYGISDARYRTHLGDLVERLEVQDLLKIQVRRLSLGERMKMELIAALLHEPRVIFLDEPTIGLDMTAQRAIREFIASYRTSHRCAILLTSHYMEDIARLCSRIVILRRGSIVYDGTLTGVAGIMTAEKFIKLSLQDGHMADPANLLLPFGLRLKAEPEGSWTVAVPPEQCAAVASTLMTSLPVAELSIGSPDIATAIEAVMRGKVEG